MKIYDRQEFSGLYDRAGQSFADLILKHCSFTGCFISNTRKTKRRSHVHNVQLVGCESRGCTIYAAVIENVLVSSLKTHTLLQTWGAVYKHVKLEGNIGRIMISPLIDLGLAKPKQQAAFDQANAEYYKTVDWALDISEARFYECDIRGVSASLIIRDPETQVVVTREKALQGKWKELDLSKTYWAGWIDLFLQSGEPDVVLVAPKRYPKYQDWLDGLKMLRDAGVAEPD